MEIFKNIKKVATILPKFERMHFTFINSQKHIELST